MSELVYPYKKTNSLTLFSEKSKHVSIFDPCIILNVNGDHLGNITIFVSDIL